MNLDGYVLVLALAALPAAGNVVGGLLAEAFAVSERALSLALHLAAGIVLGVVGLELLPRALETDLPWVPLLAFVGGGALFVALERAIGYVNGRLGAQERAGPLAIFSAVSLDLFSDGVLIGTGTVIDPTLGLLLAVGQVPADVPEGFAAIATLRADGVPRRRRLALAAAFALPVLVGATLGYLALREAPELLTLSVLALTGGALATVVVEEMVPEAHEGETSAWGGVFLTAGFALFGAVSVYTG